MAQEHINESILSEEILEDQKKNRIDHMTYLPGMEAIKSDVMDQVVAAAKAYDYDKYTAADVRRALAHDNRTPEDFAALLSPAALPLLEEIAQAAQKETQDAVNAAQAALTEAQNKVVDAENGITQAEKMSDRNIKKRILSIFFHKIPVKICIIYVFHTYSIPHFQKCNRQ